MVNGAIEDGQRALRLVCEFRSALVSQRDFDTVGKLLTVWYFVTRFVDPGKAEVAILANLSIFHSTVHQRCIASSGEVLSIGIVQRQRDCFSSEPVAANGIRMYL